MKYGIVFLHGCIYRCWLPDRKEEGKNIRRTNTHSHLNIVTCHICLSCHVYSLTELLRWTQPLFLAYVLWGALTHLADIIFNTFLSDVFKGLVSQTPSQFSSVQLFSRVRLFATPWIAARQASLSITISRSSPKLMSIKWVMPSNHLILCHPLLLLPSIFPSIRIVSNESFLCRWLKYWSFSFSISPSNEYTGLISFRIDLFDLLAVQETLKSLLQHHSSRASILFHKAFFMVQLSHLYMTIRKKHSSDYMDLCQ